MRELAQTSEKHRWFLHYDDISIDDGGWMRFLDCHRRLYEYMRFAE